MKQNNKIKVSFDGLEKLINKLSCKAKGMSKKKRDPERIDKILGLIKLIWKNNPYLRLGQLLGNCFEATEDLYYTEDDELEKGLIEAYYVREWKSSNTKSKKNS